MERHEPLEQLLPRYTPALLHELQALTASGKRVPAIHRLRQTSGMSLRWCARVVEALNADGPEALALFSTQAHLPALVELQVRALLRRDRQKEARELLGQHTDWGTETMEEFVRAHCHPGSMTHPDQS